MQCAEQSGKYTITLKGRAGPDENSKYDFNHDGLLTLLFVCSLTKLISDSDSAGHIKMQMISYISPL